MAICECLEEASSILLHPEWRMIDRINVYEKNGTLSISLLADRRFLPCVSCAFLKSSDI